MTDSLIVIPARLSATRLPDKPMAEIAGEPMIVHVWRRAVEADCGPVLVATDAEQVRDAIAKEGGDAVMTRPDHASGSDRIFEAVSEFDPDRRIDTIVNLQGDLPTLDPHLVRACVDALQTGEADIGTIAAEITREEERTNPNVV
ncbi:MAG: NTP transferase domain-containing protein, partial [Methyloceanibacter sp.]